MLSVMRTKIRALIEDLGTTTTEAFTYSNSSVFTLGEDKGITVSTVQINGNDLQSGESYSYDSDNNQVTLTATLLTDDIVTIKYQYYQYSDTELNEYIRSSLVWMSIFAPKTYDFELEDDCVYPTPDNATEDLICIIVSILIKPNYVRYSLPNNQTVVYPTAMTKDLKIRSLITRFAKGLGVNDIITFEE